MHPATPSAVPPVPAPTLTRSDLLELANFRDATGHAVSFFFSTESIPDRSHHTEETLVRDLVQEQLHRFHTRRAPGLAEDLEAVLALADEIRQSPRSWHIAYACHARSFWRKFELPAPKPIRRLDVGERFLLAPMFRAWEFCAPFAVVVFERGRARAFVVRGFHVQEFTDRMPKEKIALHIRDSRIAWIQHVDQHMEEHIRAYFKELAAKVRIFLAEDKLHEIVFGCHEFLWGEAEPMFAEFEKGIMIGRFVPSDYEMPARDVQEAAYPIFEQNRRKSADALVKRIEEDPGHGAIGENAVMEHLIEGRVQKLVLSRPVEGTVSECGNCGRVQPRTNGPCIFCLNNSLHDLPADEGLIRQAVLTDAEILTYDPDELHGFHGAAALLRY